VSHRPPAAARNRQAAEAPKVRQLQTRVEKAQRVLAYNRAGEDDLRAGRIGEDGDGAIPNFRDALALDPDILFLDEPTAGLDPIGAAAFDQLILTLRDALGLSVFLITHALDPLYTITDRIAVLSQKKVLVAGPLAEVEQTNDAWIQEYFHGPRGRAAEQAATRAGQER